jgi:hypothetical protein
MSATLPRSSTLIAAFCVAGFAAGCERRENWSFVESVGGIAVGTPQRTAQGWVLPVDADVSGLRNITTRPTATNSGIACKGIGAKVEGRAVYLTLVSQVAGQGGEARCPPVNLGAMDVGKYTVLYAGAGEPPHTIGSIVIEPSAPAR